MIGGTARRACFTGTILGIALAVLCFASPAFAVDPVPGNSCTGTSGIITNSFQWAGAPENGGVLNGIFCNGSTWTGVINFQSTGNVGIGTTTPAARFDVASAVMLGSAGTAFMAMGACTVASYTPTNTASNQTCTGVPASPLVVSVACSPSGAFSTPNTTVINARATGTANQIAVNLNHANTNAVSLTCRWTEPCQRFWTAEPAAEESDDWDGITYGNGLFVAVNESGTHRVMTSPDGITWTARTAPGSKPWTSVTYGNGLFVALAGTSLNQVMTSPDGITWTLHTISGASGGNAVVAYGNSTFVEVSFNSGVGGVATSPDGITWTAQTGPPGVWAAITYGNGLFVATDSSTTETYQVMTSPDGITWTGRTAASVNRWYDITYGNGLFVATSPDGLIMTSPDGITWTLQTNSGAYWYGVTYGNGLFVAVGSPANGPVALATSPDGINWHTETSPSANWFGGVAYGNGRFVAVSNNGTNQVETSTIAPLCP